MSSISQPLGLYTRLVTASRSARRTTRSSARRRVRRRAPLPAALLLGLGGIGVGGPAFGACGDEVEPLASCHGIGAAAKDVGSAPATVRPSTELGNPVSLTGGNKRQHEPDYAVPGSHLVFHRHYNSRNSDFDNGLGQGWTHSYAVSLFDAGQSAREIVQSDGRRLRFERIDGDAPEGTAEPSGGGDERHATTSTLFRASLPSDGYIERLSSLRHRWHLPDGRTLSFHGSFLVGIDWQRSAYRSHRRLSMYYRAQRLASVADEGGRVLRFRWTPGGASPLRGYDARPFGTQAGHLAAVTLPDGSEIGFDYDERHNLTRVRYPDGTMRRFHYDDPAWPNHLTGLSDRTGVRFATWAYDGHGRAVLSEHAGGVERVTLVHPDPDAVAVGAEVETRVSDSAGAESVYRWRRPGGRGPSLLLGSAGPGCATCPPTGIDYAYDDEGRLTSARPVGTGNALGQAFVEHVYDASGRLVETWRTDSSGRRERIERREYAGASLAPALVARPSVNPDAERVTEREHDVRGRLVSLTERGFAPFVALPGETPPSSGESGGTFIPIERVTRFAYDELGRLVAIDGPRADVEDITRLDWDAASRLVAVRPPASPALRFGAFDADGRATEIRIARAHPYRVRYGARGEIVAIEHRGTVTRFAHDAEGRLVGVTDPDGRHTRIERDAAGRVHATHDPFGRTVRIALDAESRERRRELVGLDGELVHALSIVRDASGRPTRQEEERLDDRDGRVRTRATDFEHDTAGRLRAAVRGDDGARLGIDVDPLGRVLALTRPDGTTTSYLRDALGRATGLSDARGNTTREWRDDFGALVGSDSPDTGTERLERDAAGQLVRRVREDSGVTRYRRDAAGRLRERRTADGELTTWVHDEALGRLASVTDGRVAERFAYDDEGQLVRHVREIDAHRFETAYAYDERGRLLVKTLPDGQRLHHHYHRSGANAGTLRAITRTRRFGLGERTLVAEIDLEARDGASGYLAANGIRTQRTYAPNGRIRTLEIGGRLAAGYTFDAAGRLVRIDENGEPRRYGYAGRRLISADTPGATYRYTYDAAGNRTGRRTSRADGVGMLERAVHAAPGGGNRLLAVVDERTGTRRGYRYDAGGSPTHVGELRYAYDAHRRPVSVHRGETLLASYTYNAFGERVKKAVHGTDGSSTVTYFLYDGNALVAEADGSGAITAQYVYLPGQLPVARLADGEAHFIHADHLGAPRLASDAEGRTVWQASYAPFGEARVTRSGIALPLRLPGQYADAETGTHYNYYRDYDPAAGRYLTSDPLGLLAGANTYAYVGGNPLGAIDPLGLAAATAPLTITATAVVAGTALYGWLVAAAQAGVATVAAAGAGPVVAVVGVAALAVYFYSRYDGSAASEEGFGEEFGDKPAESDYLALQRELEAYAPWLGSPMFAPWDGSWSSYFEMARQLEDAQRTFIADYEATYGAGYCPLPDVRARYDGAVAAVAAADAAPESDSDEETSAPPVSTPANPPPECDEAGRQVREALYDNKHDRLHPETGRPMGGHGYLRRMLEQMCGAHGPGSRAWIMHEQQLIGERNNIGKASQFLRNRRNQCLVTQHVSRRDRQLMSMIESREGWRPESIRWLGRTDPRCADWESIARGDDNGRLIRKLLELAGGSL